jgi:hypothetical protein
MATIVTRSGKGSPLTHAEVDANFENLNSDKLEASGGTVTGALGVTGNLTVDTNTLFVDATNNRVGIGTSSPAALISVPIGTTPTLSQTAATAHSAGNVGSLGLAINDGGGYSGVFVNNTHNGTFSSQDIRLLTAEGGISTATERMRIDASGNLLLGTSSTFDNVSFLRAQFLDGLATKIDSTLSTSQVSFFNPNGRVGHIATSGTSTSYITSSDYRLKENVVPLVGAASRLAQIPVHRFNFIADPDTVVDGFLAHEVQAFVPECVTGLKDQVETVEVTDEDGNVIIETRPVYQGIDQSKLVPLLTAALQEALARIETLEADVAALKGKPA